MGLDLEYIEGQSPIDEDEKEGLKIRTISTRGELDEFEQKNIEKAIEWTYKNKFDYTEILTEDFVSKVHKQMFNEVWEWAGKRRNTNKNIGVDKFQIFIELKNLLDDCKYWIENQTYEKDEIAIRFKHRLVKIHIFPNGNGRHARLCADILISHVFKKPVFTWGNTSLSKMSDTRRNYLNALYQADDEVYYPLIQFARS